MLLIFGVEVRTDETDRQIYLQYFSVVINFDWVTMFWNISDKTEKRRKSINFWGGP